MGEDPLLEHVTTAAEECSLSQNIFTAHRRTWLELIGWASERLALETCHRTGQESSTRRRRAAAALLITSS